jgi:hypothetical protein
MAKNQQLLRMFAVKNMNDKTTVIAACIAQVSDKLKALGVEIHSLQESNADNDKSTAGDKYDTERSMVHQEMDKLIKQTEIEGYILNQLEQMNPDKHFSSAASGGLISTNKGNYLLGAACGKVMLDKTLVFGVSMASPLAKAMLGKTKGDVFSLNGNDFEIKEII